jgi:hypothetical protein
VSVVKEDEGEVRTNEIEVDNGTNPEDPEEDDRATAALMAETVAEVESGTKRDSEQGTEMALRETT